MSRAKSSLLTVTADLSKVDSAVASIVSMDMSELTERVRATYMEPLKEASWMGSGLRSRSGELSGAIRTFAGKSTVGIGIQKPGTRSLVMAKAYTHTLGVRKFGFKQRLTKRDIEHAEVRKKLGLFKGKRRSPWGAIPARPFMPVTVPDSVVVGIRELFARYIDDRLGRIR